MLNSLHCLLLFRGKRKNQGSRLVKENKVAVGQRFVTSRHANSKSMLQHLNYSGFM